MKRKILISVMLIGIHGVIITAQDQNQQTDKFEALREAYAAYGMEEVMKIVADTAFLQKGTVSDSDIISYCVDLYNTGNKDDAIILMEAGLRLVENPFRIYRTMATMYYETGREGDAEIFMKEFEKKRGELFLKRYVERTGEDNILKTAHEVIDRYLDVTGGKEAWENISTMIVTVSVQPETGREMKLLRYYKRPGFFRQEMEGGNSFSSTDGRTTWTCRNGNWAEAKFKYRNGSIDEYMTGLEQMDINYLFEGLVYMDNEPAYRIKRVFPDGFTQELFFSAVSGFLTEIKSDYPEGNPFINSWYSLWDYRQVDGGVKLPFVNIRNVGNTAPPHGSVICDVKINVPLADSLFLPPGR